MPLNRSTGLISRAYIRFGRTVEADRLELAALEAAFAKGDAGTVRQTWERWLKAAKAGDKNAHDRIYAFWVRRMTGELTNPDPVAPRFHNGQITSELASPDSLIEKALFGLYAYYLTNKGLQRELTADVAHLFEPVMEMVREESFEGMDWNHHPHVWGQALINIIYPNLKPEQQAAFLQLQKEQLFEDPAEEKRQKIIARLGHHYSNSPDLPFWEAELRPALKTWLDRTEVKADPESREEAKYPLLLLSLMGETLELTSPFSGPEEAPDLQVAVAWIAGRKPSEQGFRLLETMLDDLAYDERCQEMALISLGEYAKSDRFADRAGHLIAAFLPKDGQPETPLEEVALAVHTRQETFQNLEQPDFYIHQWISGDEERESYRRLRDAYIISGLDTLDTPARNMIDRVLIPYRRYLPDILKAGHHHTITSPGAEAITEQPECREYIGIRDEDGSLYDSFRGVALVNGHSVTSHTNISRDGTNDFAHEFFHHLHDDVLKHRAERDYSRETAWVGKVETVQARIESLYGAAVSDDRALDDYGVTEGGEYAAQGNAAWDVRMMDHDLLMNYAFRDGYYDHVCNIRAKLMRRDRPLYEFLKALPGKTLWQKPTSFKVPIN